MYTLHAIQTWPVGKLLSHCRQPSSFKNWMLDKRFGTCRFILTYTVKTLNLLQTLFPETVKYVYNGTWIKQKPHTRESFSVPDNIQLKLIQICF
jgi:hypothetical protein